jgi:hypothetical protein
MPVLELVWTIRPRHTPVVSRRCPRCDLVRPFVSSDKFRINASGRKLDVWLIYKCGSCKQTWNSTIMSRVAPESLDRALYQSFLNNDRDTAWRYAFDYEVLKRNEAEFDPKIEFDVEGDRIPAGTTAPEARVRLVFQFLVSLRLETLLAHQLGVSRSKLEQLFDAGAVRTEPEMKLSKKPKGNLVVVVDLAKLFAAQAESERRGPT